MVAAPPSAPDARAAEEFRRYQGEVRASARKSVRRDDSMDREAAALRASIRQNQEEAYGTLRGPAVGGTAPDTYCPGQRPGKAHVDRSPPRAERALLQ